MVVALQIYIAVALFVFAADASALDGRWSAELDLPFAGFAVYAFLLVPFAVLLPLKLPRRVWPWGIVAGDAIALGCVMVPTMVFSSGAGNITWPGEHPSHQKLASLRAELGHPIVVVGHSGCHLYFNRTHDAEEIKACLRRHGIEPND